MLGVAVFTLPMHAVSSTCHRVNCCFNFLLEIFLSNVRSNVNADKLNFKNLSFFFFVVFSLSKYMAVQDLDRVCLEI